MRVTVRLARPDELKIVQELNHQLFEHDFEWDPALNKDWPLEPAGESYFRGMISGEIGVCFVGEVGGKLVGYLAGCIKLDVPKYRPVKISELENMFVLPQYRGTGVGRALVKTFIDWSRQKGMSKCKVSAYAGNERAIDFYKRAGFLDYAAELEADL